MALPDSSRLPEKAELIAALDQTRAALTRDFGDVGRTLDLSSRFRSAYASGSWRWLAGAFVAGIVAGITLPGGKAGGAPPRTPGRPRVPPAATAVLGFLARALFSQAAEPALARLAADQLDKWMNAALRKS
jgi:hypothetical protein